MGLTMDKIVYILLFFTLTSWSQNDTINQSNKEGRKTGHWVITGDQRNEPDYCYNCVIEEGVYKRSRKQGLWTKYYPNGQLKSIIEYENGKANGPYATYYKNGNSQKTGKFRAHEASNISYTFSEEGCVTKRNIGNESFTIYCNDCALKSQRKGNFEYDILSEYFYPRGIDSILTKNAFGSIEKIDTILKTRGLINICEPSIGPLKFSIYPESDLKNLDTIIHFNRDSIKPIPLSQIASQNIDKESRYGKCYNKEGNILQDGQYKEGYLYNGKQYVYDEYGLLDHIKVFKEGKFVGNGVID
ncbi:MAG: hypothetical protein ACI9N1_001333 [Flavobacteriales bacterium]|jgi:hypothetical protein